MCDRDAVALPRRPQGGRGRDQNPARRFRNRWCTPVRRPPAWGSDHRRLPGRSPYTFTGGTINRVAVDVSGDVYVDLEREAEMLIRQQRSETVHRPRRADERCSTALGGHAHREVRTQQKAPPRGAFPVRPRGLEPPRTIKSTRPSTRIAPRRWAFWRRGPQISGFSARIGPSGKGGCSHGSRLLVGPGAPRRASISPRQASWAEPWWRSRRSQRKRSGASCCRWPRSPRTAPSYWSAARRLRSGRPTSGWGRPRRRRIHSRAGAFDFEGSARGPWSSCSRRRQHRRRRLARCFHRRSRQV